MKNLDKYRGCLIGGAAGDALGYPVEFLRAADIVERFGKSGITEFEYIDGIAQISDDTQMTLFTANGLLLGTTRGMMRGIMGPYPSYVSSCYKDWLRTQTGDKLKNGEYQYAWLLNVRELWKCRAPGRTCLEAIRRGGDGEIQKPINQSKGCGGIMRVAPVGLYFEGKPYAQDEVDIIGAEVAALTHGHELGYIPAAALVHIINLVAHDDMIPLISAVEDAMGAMRRLFGDAKHLPELLTLIQTAIDLSDADISDSDAIHQLGEGWVAEETLAIAIYCSLKHQDDFEKALVAAVNHSGDSDSTGAVTGNILGAYLGLEKIPQKFRENLEIIDVITEIADDLYHDCKMTEYGEYKDKVWTQKYIKADYSPQKHRSMQRSSTN